MAHKHNWHQFVVVLEQIGYRQIIDYDIDILYFINQSVGKEIGFEKSNHISMPYALTLLRRLEIPYDRFVRIYTEYSEGKVNKTTENLFDDSEWLLDSNQYEEHLQEYSGLGLDIASKIALFLSRHLNARKSVTKSAERP